MPPRVEIVPNTLMEGTSLVFIKDTHPHTPRKSLFECVCGALIERPFAWVRHKNTTSCGCVRSALTTKKNQTHGQAGNHTKSGAYRSWQAMNQRVLTNPKYKDREICQEWLWPNGFQQFYADMGDRPKNKSLDRINNNLGYSASNCRWASQKEQMNNMSSNTLVTYENVEYTLTQLCEKLSVSMGLVKQRRRRGMGILEAILTPVNLSKSHKTNKKG